MIPALQASLNALLQRGLPRLQVGMRPVMVVSHERSGTHFTMNSLASCFGYVSEPWIDLDYSAFSINYHHPRVLGVLLQALGGLRFASIVKSHHEFGFFNDLMAETKDLQIVYVYRRPAHVMLSFWRFVYAWPWNEGPKTAGALEFAMARPTGGVMRYQQTERGTMLDRWAAHVAGWVEASERYENVHAVRYEDLDENYEATVRRLGEVMGARETGIVRPPADAPGIRPTPRAEHLGAGPQDAHAIWQLALKRHPLLMQRLGYADPPLSMAG